MRSVTLPWSRPALIGGIMLGMGRALGETMAVTFVIGNTNRIGWSLFSPGNTIASLIALEFPEPGGEPETGVAAGAGVHPDGDLVPDAGLLAAAAAAWRGLRWGAMMEAGAAGTGAAVGAGGTAPAGWRCGGGWWTGWRRG
jgi:hypothetical protein